MIERNISEYRENEVNRVIQHRVGPTVPTVELDAGDADVDDGRQVEEDQEGQGSYQAGLGESQEIEIVTDFCLGKSQSKCDDDIRKIWLKSQALIGALPYHSTWVADIIPCSYVQIVQQFLHFQTN